MLKALDLFADLSGVLRDGDRLDHALEVLALRLFHLFEVFGVGKFGRRGSGKLAGALQVLGQPVNAILQRMTQGVGARREPALIEGH